MSLWRKPRAFFIDVTNMANLLFHFDLFVEGIALIHSWLV